MKTRCGIRLDREKKNIFIEQIDWQDDRYLISYGRPSGPLEESIKEIGLQLPPILEEKSPGRFRIVTGRRRSRAVQRIGREGLAAEVLARSYPVREVLRFAFYENLGQRDFNFIEISLLLKKLSSWVSPKDLINRYLPLLNLPPKKEIRDRYLALTEISQVYWKALLEGRLFPETVISVREHFPIRGELLLSLMLFLHWGYQKQREFIIQLQEIDSAGEADGDLFLNSEALQRLLEEPLMTAQQKGEALRRQLRSRRYPTLLGLEAFFAEKRKHMALDSRTDLAPPPFFEGGRYRLSIDFARSQDLRESLQKVTRSLDEGKLDDLP
jgi:hypothetical protein